MSTVVQPQAKLFIPPSSYRPQFEKTRQIISAQHPALTDLVDKGVLIACPRHPDYKERRDDGYQEPLEVFVIGTSHVSTESARDVERAIRELRPDNVVVEACRSRSSLLFDDDSASSSGLPSTRDLTRALQQGGGVSILLRLALAQLSKKITKSIGDGSVRPGIDMRTAARVAEEIGAQLVLGDRPLEISLERAWNSLSSAQRTKIASALWQAFTQADRLGPVTQQDIEAMKQQLDITALLESVGNEYPGFVTAMVTERDNYLAWSLKRSKAVNGCKRVVGVVGQGHLRGIQYVLESDKGELRFVDLVEGRNTREWKENRRKEQIKQLVVDVLLWTGAFEALKFAFFNEL